MTHSPRLHTLVGVAASPVRHGYRITSEQLSGGPTQKARTHNVDGPAKYAVVVMKLINRDELEVIQEPDISRCGVRDPDI